MVFAHDTETSLAMAAELVNTSSALLDEDTLATLEALEDFAERWDVSGHRAGDSDELAAVRALRPQVRLAWLGEESETVETVNGLLASGRALPQLVRHDDWDWHVHATRPDDPLATRLAVEIAMALVDVVRTGERERLRRCGRDDCDHVLVDLSRNRSRRFCSDACANRTHAAAYRARLSSPGG